MEIASNEVIESYSYPGGTLHISSWATGITGIIVLGFALFTPNLFIAKRLGFSVFGLLWLYLGISSELNFKRVVGRIEVRKSGIWYTRPWQKPNLLLWEDVKSVQCLWNLSKFRIESWEIRGNSPKDLFIINSELKGYKQLLSSIQQRSPNAVFDETPSQQTSR